MKTAMHRVFVIALGVIGTATMAAGANSERDAIAARYEAERAMCLRGQSAQDRDTCLREAGAAQAQAKRGGQAEDQAALKENRFQRCERLPEKDRPDCVARMEGKGTISGSVESGGIYRELVTTERSAPAR